MRIASSILLLLACGCGGREARGVSARAGSELDDGGVSGHEASTGLVADCTTDSIFVAVAPVPFRYVLEAFHPGTGQTTTLGPFDCHPWGPDVTYPLVGLAVDRSGALYAANNGGVFRVEATAAGYACALTNLLVLQDVDLQPLGIGFARTSASAESLFAIFFYSVPKDSALSGATGVGVVGLDGGVAHLIGDGDADLLSGLTGTSDGRLFGIDGVAQRISQIDPATGTTMAAFPYSISQSYLRVGEASLAFWAGDFYTFPNFVPSPDGGSESVAAIVRVHPSDGTTQVVGQLDGAVYGAAVSTCAPLQ